jgi:hypothetical protein
MATIISTKTTGVGGLSVTGDASGILQLASADGTTALTIDASQNVGIGTSSPATKLSIKGTTATDAPTLGAELLTGGTWTSTGWTGNNTTGWVNGASNATALSYSIAAVISTKYQIAYTVTRTAGSFTVTFGGQSLAGITATGTFGPTATTTGNLVITPTSTFVGTIVLSIKEITAASTALITALDSTGVSKFEMRATTGTGFNNTFLGLSSGLYNTTGILNTSIGVAALAYNTTGQGNSAVGFNALVTNTTGIFNTAVGARALQANTIGNSNSAFGLLTLAANTTGNSNCAFGQQALTSNTTGNSNVAVGLYALLNNTTGSSNTAIGTGAGQVIANGSTTLTIVNNSTYVGYATRASADNVTNETVIGYAAVGSGSNTITLGGSTVTGTIIPYGNVGIGTSSPSQKLEVSGASASTGNVNARVTNTQSAVSVDLAVTGSAYSYLNIPASGAYLYSTSSLSLANSSANPITFITNSTERMRIDSAGRVTYSNNPAFITGSVAGGTTYTSGVKVNYSNNVYNRGSCWNSTNNYFVAPVAGYYFFKAQLWTYTGVTAAAYFRVNGSWRYGSFGNEATNIGFNGYAMVEMFYLAANDYVDVACRLGTVYTDSSFSTFSGYLIG